MFNFNNDDVKALLKKSHAGMIILMPGAEFVCPGKQAILQKTGVIIGLNGCPSCLLYAIRGLMDKQPEFKKLITDAVNPNFHP